MLLQWFPNSQYKECFSFKATFPLIIAVNCSELLNTIRNSKQHIPLCIMKHHQTQTFLLVYRFNFEVSTFSKIWLMSDSVHTYSDIFSINVQMYLILIFEEVQKFSQLMETAFHLWRLLGFFIILVSCPYLKIVNLT